MKKPFFDYPRRMTEHHKLIIQMICDGYSVREISMETGRSQDSVNASLKYLRKKQNVKKSHLLKIYE